MAGERMRAQERPMDALVAELWEAGEMNWDPETAGKSRAVQAIPLRYRLIAMAFVRHASLEEVEQLLEENGCPRLYVRSYREASLLYAFQRGLSYESWKRLQEECLRIREGAKAEKGELSGASVSLEDLRAYVGRNSDLDGSVPLTRNLTLRMEKQLRDLGHDEKVFLQFMEANALSFSEVREKTRYYFVKYLVYWLETRMDRYFRQLSHGRSVSQALPELEAFRVRTVLERKKMDEEEARERIGASPLSPGRIYEAFENFYFGYIRQDWFSVLLETCGDVSLLEPAQKKRVAAALRKTNRQLAKASDDEVLAWRTEQAEREEAMADERFSLERGAAPSQAGRSGETFLRRVIRGDVDMDRTTLLAFLVFLSRTAKIPAMHEVNGERLKEILSRCGFAPLKEENPTDAFFLRFLEAEDPMDFLMEEVENLALSEENFYLYKTYLSSRSAEGEWSAIV